MGKIWAKVGIFRAAAKNYMGKINFIFIKNDPECRKNLRFWVKTFFGCKLY